MIMAVATGVLLMTNRATASDPTTYSFPVKGEISHAEVFIRVGVEKPRAVLVLCPGQNESGEPLVSSRVWQEYADRNGLALVSLYFHSSNEDLLAGKGYFLPERGSGEILDKALRMSSLDELPLFLYGFSGGAHFARNYANWNPGKVAAFCAYSFAWWRPIAEKLKCPALIVCGQEDGTRYAAALTYFQMGRKKGLEWVWVSLGGQMHRPSAALDEFVREYFACLLEKQMAKPVMVNNVTKKIAKENSWKDVSASVLPCGDLLPSWRELHHP